jgi:hypothetical protein
MARHTDDLKRVETRPARMLQARAVWQGLLFALLLVLSACGSVAPPPPPIAVTVEPVDGGEGPPPIGMKPSERRGFKIANIGAAPLTYTWDATGGKFDGCNSDKSLCYYVAPERPGEQTLTVRGNDGQGNIVVQGELRVNVQTAVVETTGGGTAQPTPPPAPTVVPTAMPQPTSAAASAPTAAPTSEIVAEQTASPPPTTATKAQPAISYDFETGTHGWVAQDYKGFHAIPNVEQSADQHRSGQYSLALHVDLKDEGPAACEDREPSEGKCKGETYVQFDKSLDLTGVPIKVWVYVPAAEAVGSSAAPNGLQVFVKDVDFNSYYGSWTVLRGRVGAWFDVEIKPSTQSPPNGKADDKFDPAKVIAVGVKVAAGSRSGNSYKGTIYIDDVQIGATPLQEIFPQAGAGETFDFKNGTANITSRFVDSEECRRSGLFGLQLEFDMNDRASGGWGVHWANTPIGHFDASGFTNLVFWVKGTAPNGFNIGLQDTDNVEVQVGARDFVLVNPDKWTMVTVPLSRFATSERQVTIASVRNVNFGFNSNHGSGRICIDDIAFQ